MRPSLRLATLMMALPAALVLPAQASGPVTVTASTFQTHSATGCVGTEINGIQNCGNPILPITNGQASAVQSASADGNFALADHAQGGGAGGVPGIANGPEWRYASSSATVQTDYILPVSVHTVSVAVVYRFDGASITQQNADYSSGFVNGYIFAGTYSARTPPLGVSGDTDCTDNSRIQATGTYVGSNVTRDSPPGIYTLQVGFTCGKDALIRPNQAFNAFADIIGVARTDDPTATTDVSLTGQLLSVSFSYVVP